jgi:flagellar assembly factor FliW
LPRIETKAFGTLDYQTADLIEFPQGLIGFEEHRRFLAVDRPQSKPFVFLQSIEQPDLFFVTIPPALVDPGYELQLLDEHMATLSLSDTASVELMILSVVCLPESGPATANLLGPLVIHCPSGRGVQAVRDDRKYSAVHPIEFEAAPCS